MGAAIAVQLNGETLGLPAGTTVEEVVASLAASRTGIAVAVNGAVVPRSSWALEQVRDGDRVEVLTAAQGG
jgi:sulfur carrier protein